MSHVACHMSLTMVLFGLSCSLFDGISNRPSKRSNSCNRSRTENFLSPLLNLLCLFHLLILSHLFPLLKILQFSQNRPSGPIISLSQNVRMCVCLFVFCPSHFLTLFNGIFAPTSGIPMPKLFRFLES